jgi:tRNA(Ile)-lysidine synthase
VLDDLDAARTTRRSLTGGWSLFLGAHTLHFLPPGSEPPRLGELRSGPGWKQLGLPAIHHSEDLAPPEGLILPLDGSVQLPDGRVLRAERVEVSPGSPVPESPTRVELDSQGLQGPLVVRWPRSGDRFHALGAPGSKRLFRFLADCGVPAHDRRSVPLVYEGAEEQELLWVAGIRIAESRRVRARTQARLRLELL